MQRGFIQIPVLVTIFLGVVAFGGTSFFSYEMGKKTGLDTKERLSYSNENWSMGTSTELAGVIVGTTEETEGGADAEPKKAEAPKQVEKKPVVVEKKAPQEDSTLLSTLQKQIDSLKSSIAESKPAASQTASAAEATATTTDATSTALGPNQIRLPNGSIVQIDANGNIVQHISGPSAESTADTTTTASTISGELTIAEPQLKMGLLQATLTWETDKESKSKITITGGGFTSKEFPSMVDLGKAHSIEVVGFEIKENPTYTYEIEAKKNDGSGITKRSGTFKLLSRSYDDIVSAYVETPADINRDRSCKELFFIAERFLVCTVYRASQSSQ